MAGKSADDVSLERQLWRIAELGGGYGGRDRRGQDAAWAELEGLIAEVAARFTAGVGHLLESRERAELAMGALRAAEARIVHLEEQLAAARRLRQETGERGERAPEASPRHPAADPAAPSGGDAVETPASPGGEGRYALLQVGATPAGLLPVDLRPLLVEGAVVLRREGRIAALVGVPSALGPEGPAEAPLEQARRFEEAGLRVVPVTSEGEEARP